MSFFKKISILSMGTGIAFLITFAVSPILTRLYSSEQFGTNAIFLASAALLSIVVNGKYDVAIIKAKTLNKSYDFFMLSNILTVFFMTILFLALIVLFCLGFFNLKSEFIVFLTLPVLVVLINLKKGLINLLNKTEEYNEISKLTLFQSIYQAGSRLFFVKTVFISDGLILGVISGAILNSISTIRKSLNFHKKIGTALSQKYLRKLKILASSNLSNPKYLIPSELINALALQTPLWFVSIFYGLKEAGYLSIALTMVQAPFLVAGDAIGRVIRQEISEITISGNSPFDHLVKRQVMIGLVSIVPVVVFYLYSPQVFQFIFGADWSTAGRYLQILVFYIFCQFFQKITSYVYILGNKQSEILVFQIIYLILSISSFAIPYFLNYGIYNSLKIYAILGGSLYLMMFFRSLQISKKII